MTTPTASVDILKYSSMSRSVESLICSFLPIFLLRSPEVVSWLRSSISMRGISVLHGNSALLRGEWIATCIKHTRGMRT